MAEYTPSEGHVRDRYVSYEALDRPGPEPEAEFDRFLARVRRDAAREALDGLARLAVQVEDGHGQLVPAERVRDDWAMVEIAARTYRDTHYPEPFADGAADHYPEETP